jgi:glycosyltransferase involved in cell wall biosynthesis
MKLLFLAYYFPPLGGSAVQRARKFAQYLPVEGFRVSVITAPITAKDLWAPKDSSLTESMTGVSVHHVDGAPPDPSGKLGQRVSRILGVPSAFSKWWVKSAVDLSVKVASDADLILATMSPFESAIAAGELSARLKIPWIADLRDPWALDETIIYPTLLSRKIEMLKMERSLSSAALIIMNTPQAARDVKRDLPALRKNNIIAITNGFDAEDFSEALICRTDSRFRIVHSGIMLTKAGLQLRNRKLYRFLGGVERGVDIITRSPEYLLRAVENWHSSQPEIKDDVELWFAGNGSSEDHHLFSTSKMAGCVRAVGHLPHKESLQLIRTADLLFLPMHNLPPGRRCRSIPGKAYEYMASGRPILAALPEGDARDILTECGTAFVCLPDDVENMTRILREVYAAWKHGNPTIKKNDEFLDGFTRKHLTHTLAISLRSVIRQRRVGIA